MSVRLTTRLLAVACLVVLTGCTDLLLKDLNQAQANEVIALLYKHNIDAKKQSADKGKYSIVVDKDQFAEAVELLTIHQMPSAPRLEIEHMFPTDALVSTPLAERARLLSGLERRLESTLQQLESVTSARVHASYDLSGDRALVAPESVAVVLTVENADQQPIFVEKVKQLIKNSFQQIEYDNISVVLFERAARPVSPGLVGIGTAPQAGSLVLGALAGLIAAMLAAVTLYRVKRGRWPGVNGQASPGRLADESVTAR